MSNGQKKLIIDVEPGDQVKAIDSNGQLIDTEVVSIMHKDVNKEGKVNSNHFDSPNNFSN
jgi:hypothetical protein